MANLLKIGGILVIDDLHIWTCELLTQFLDSEKEWCLFDETLSAGIFVKRGNNFQDKEWLDQAFVLSRSRQKSFLAKVRYLLHLTRRRNLPLLRNAVSLGISSAVAGRFGVRETR
jgi:hypothetical protein